ncbi:MAG: hypothetical protein E6H92_14205 [Chloroflexi bacterium]|nr:MAG: hypothetical protein E6H92_14205 [Chloroflexota bacterium]
MPQESDWPGKTGPPISARWQLPAKAIGPGGPVPPPPPPWPVPPPGGGGGGGPPWVVSAKTGLLRKAIEMAESRGMMTRFTERPPSGKADSDYSQ